MESPAYELTAAMTAGSIATMQTPSTSVSKAWGFLNGVEGGLIANQSNHNWELGAVSLTAGSKVHAEPGDGGNLQQFTEVLQS